MKKLIHLLIAILPVAAFSDTWVESGRPAVAAGPIVNVSNGISVAVTNPPAQISLTVTNIQVGGGGAADNLGDHTATADLNMATFGITNAGPVGITGGGMSGGYALRAVYGGPSAWDMVQFVGGSPSDAVGFWPWNANDGDVLAYSTLYDAWVPAAPAAGHSLLGQDVSDPSDGGDVFVRAGSVTGPLLLQGHAGTTYIQGATNDVTSKQGGIVIATVGGGLSDSRGGGDITLQTGDAGGMGGAPGELKLLAGTRLGALGPRFLLGNETMGTWLKSDGTNLVLAHAGAQISIMSSRDESTRWLVLQDQSTTLVLSNGSVSVDGNACYSGTPGVGQVPVFTKGLCTGITTP